jgi:acylphosphatase
MKLTAFVSGKVQEVGYRARVVDLANALGLKVASIEQECTIIV